MSPLTEDERRALLSLARAAIEQRLFGGDVLARARATLPPAPALEARRGAFVTLEDDDLRGCIGEVEGKRPLHETVERAAVASAFEDPRFRPMTAAGWNGVSVSISALTPSRPVDGPAAIVLGRHGVVLERGARRSIFLPQVAADHGWGVEELLAQLSRKAGLPSVGWREGKLFVFEAEVFGER